MSNRGLCKLTQTSGTHSLIHAKLSMRISRCLTARISAWKLELVVLGVTLSPEKLGVTLSPKESGLSTIRTQKCAPQSRYTPHVSHLGPPGERTTSLRRVLAHWLRASCFETSAEFSAFGFHFLKNTPLRKVMIITVHLQIPSGKRLHNYGKSPCFMGKFTINGDCA